MKKANKILSIILVILMVISIIPITASAATYSGVCGENVTWIYDSSTYTLTISGTGDMKSYSTSNRPWESYEDKIKTVVISDGVTSIGRYAFYSFGSVTSITIPNSVTKISDRAFNACKVLTTITLPEGITTIPDAAFTNCSALTSITIPSSVTTIGLSAFKGCSSLTGITIPEGVTSIGDNAFSSCKKLSSITVDSKNAVYSSDESGVLFNKNKTELIRYPIGNTATSYTIPESVTTIGTNAFNGSTNLTGVTVSDSVTKIGSYSFSGCTGLTGITIPENVTTIEEYAFNGCSGLQNIVFDENSSITVINQYVFTECDGLTSVILPDSVTKIGTGAFLNCDKLASVTIPDSVITIEANAFKGTALYNNTVNWENNVLYIGDYLIVADTSISGDVQIKDGTKKIAENAFYGSSNITSITIPASVTIINSKAFLGCHGITSLVIPEGVTTLGTEAFAYCSKLENITIPSTLTITGTAVFANCSLLATVAFADGTTVIPDNIFANCTSITKVVIPEGVTTIGAGAFADCSNLDYLSVPKSLKTVETGAFSGCTSLKQVIYAGDYNDWEAITVKENNDPFANAKLFDGETTPDNPEGEEITPDTPGKYMEWKYDEETATLTIFGKGSMGSYSFSDDPWNEYKDSIKKVVIEDGITTIGTNAFREFYNLESVVIPDSVTEIHNYAFEMCNSLTSITIPDSVTKLGIDAFFHCISLTNVIIGDGVTTIELSTFAQCRNLENVVIGDSVTILRSGAFQDCAKLKTVTFGKSLKTIESRAFSGCSSLESVAIPDSVTKMDRWAFSDCTSLTSVKLGNGLTSTGEYAFDNCTNLASVTFGNSITVISDCSFYGCTKLESIVTPSTVTEIKSSAFSGCTSLKNVTLNECLTTIGSNAFANCDSLVSIKIPDSVTTINSYAFADCDSLKSIAIGKNVTTIGNAIAYGSKSLTAITIDAENPNYSVDEYGVLFNKDKTVLIQYPCGSPLTEYTIPDSVKTVQTYAFNKCANLQTVTIPLSVTTIEERAFDESTNLKNIVYKGTKEDWETRITYNKDKNVKLKYSLITFEPTDVENVTTICGDNATWTLNLNTGKMVISGTGDMYDFEYNDYPWINYRDYIKEVVISEGITRIGHYAFYYCKNLKTIAIPSTVTSIGGDVFSICSSLESITVDSNNPAYSNDEYGVLFNKDKTRLVKYPQNGAQTEYTVPSTVETIGYEAFFSCNTLKKIVLNDGVTTISYGAFVGCGKLESLTIPTTVTTTDSYIISRNETIVYYKGTLAQWKKLLEDNDDGDYSSSLKYYTVYCSDEAYHPSGSCGENVTWKFDTVKGTLIISGTGAMANYEYYEDYYGEVYVVDRPWEMFAYDTKSVVIEDGVTTIGACAFLDCSNLTSIVIGDSVESINFSAFAYCDNLEKFVVDEDNQHYSSDEYGVLFNKDKTKLIECPVGNKITNYTVPDTVTEIVSGAFYGCSSLVKVVLGKNVAVIGESAFENCTLLTNLTVPKTVTEIKYNAFNGCYKLTDVQYLGTLEDWNKIVIDSGNSCLTDAIFKFDYSGVQSASGKCGDNLTWAFYSDTGTLVISGTGAMYDYDIAEEEYTPWNDFKTEIKKLIIEEGVTTIGNDAFVDCIGIKRVEIPYTVTAIGHNAFTNCDGLTTIDIPYGVQTLGEYAFSSCDNLRIVTIPSSMSVVSAGAFKNCNNLETIVLCEGVTELEMEAFEDCRNIKEVFWPRSLTTIGWGAFYSYSMSIDIYYGGTEEEWEYIKYTGLLITKPFNSANKYFNYPVPVQKFTGIKDNHFYKEDVMQKAYQLVEFEGDFYFIGDRHEIIKNKTTYLNEARINGLTYADGTPIAVGYYDFDENGKMVMREGIVGNNVYKNNTQLKAYQLVEVDGDFYYIGDRHEIVKNKRVYLKEERINGLTYADGTPITAGYYDFDENGKMIILNGIVGNNIYKNNTKLKAYQLVEIDGDFYFIGDRHEIVKNKKTYLNEERINGLTYADGTPIAVGYYEFDENGKMIILNGIVGNNIYKNNTKLKAYQLVEIDGDFYFIGDRHEIVKDKKIYLNEERINGLTYADGTPIATGYHNVDADGKLIIE